MARTRIRAGTDLEELTVQVRNYKFLNNKILPPILISKKTKNFQPTNIKKAIHIFSMYKFIVAGSVETLIF
jgi:hypothetical protein